MIAKDAAQADLRGGFDAVFFAAVSLAGFFPVIDISISFRPLAARWRSGGAAAEGEPLRAVRIDGPGLIALSQIHHRGPCPRPGTRPIGSIEP